MIELHLRNKHNFDNGGEVLVNTAEIAYIGRHYKAGTAISDGTFICFRSPAYAAGSGSVWGMTLNVSEDYDVVKRLWLNDQEISVVASPPP